MPTDLPITPDGDDSFVGGMDSFRLPSKLPPGKYAYSMNTICRGGMIQTRPGSTPLPLNFPKENLQGITFFTPTGSNPALVWATNGVVWVSYAPFTTLFHLPNISFNPNSKQISWAKCVKSTYYDESGELQFLDNPVNVLVMQDGNTRAAYWDGVNNGHLNPSPSPTTPEADGYNETPVGLWMVWSNNRLWVSRGTQVFASDIGNPLKFSEATYLNEGRAFYLPDGCTGVCETPDRKGILCFTHDTGTLIQSAIQDRTKWLSTPDFQQLALPDVGCVAPRTIVQQYGMLWWQSARGLINLDDALRTHISSELQIRDLEMYQSKYSMDSDISLACGGSIENFILQALPVSEGKNTRIHVMDRAPSVPSSNDFGAWASYWTGWRPVEFAKGTINNTDFIFILSYDYDGDARIWRLFSSNKTDGGVPITSFVITKQHLFGNRDYKKFQYGELEMQAITGQTAVSISVAGMRGGFQQIMSKDISSVNGQIYYDQDYGVGVNDFAGSRPQSRIVFSVDYPDPSDCNSECVESSIKGVVDKAFSLMFVWSGIAGISAYRLFSQTYPVNHQGFCEIDETDDHLLTPEGCGVIGIFSAKEDFDTFYSTATYSVVINQTFHLSNGSQATVQFPLSFTKTASSDISQLDADRKALALAKFYVNEYLALPS